MLETTDQATSTAGEIIAIFGEDKKKIETLGQAANTALRLHEFTQRLPVVSVQISADKLQLSPPTIRKAVEHLEELDVLIESTGKKRDKRYAYQRYMDQLVSGTEPL